MKNSTEIKNDKDGFKFAQKVLQGASKFEESKEKPDYNPYFSGENKGNCNSSQTALNEAAGGEYEKNLTARQWVSDLLYPSPFGLPFASRHNINKSDLKKHFTPEPQKEETQK